VHPSAPNSILSLWVEGVRRQSFPIRENPVSPVPSIGRSFDKLHRACESRGHPVGIGAEFGLSPMTVSQPPCNRWSGLSRLCCHRAYPVRGRQAV